MRVSQWAVPDAKRVPSSDVAEGRARAALFGSSLSSGDAAAATGADAYRTRLELWRSKTGRTHRTPEQAARTRVAVALAPVIVSLFAEARGLTTRRVALLTGRARPWQLARIDALTDDGGLVDATTTTERHRDEWVDPVTGAELVPAYARARALHDLAVSGRSHAWIACLLVDSRTLLVRRVDRDEAELAALSQAEEDFWVGHVLADVAPAPVARDNELMADVHPLADRAAVKDVPDADVLRDRREHLKDEISYLEGQVAAIEQRVKAEAGDATTITCQGEKIATWDQTGRFDAERFASAFPELAARYTVVAATLNWSQLLAEHPEHIGYRGRVLRWTPSGKGRKIDGDRAHRSAWETAA